MSKPQLAYAIASLRSGAIKRPSEDADVAAQLEDLAATLPEMFGTVDSICLERIAARLGADPSTEQLSELVLISQSHVHVIHPLAGTRSDALLAVSPASRSIGLILSQVHAQVAALKEEP